MLMSICSSLSPFIGKRTYSICLIIPERIQSQYKSDLIDHARVTGAREFTEKTLKFQRKEDSPECSTYQAVFIASIDAFIIDGVTLHSSSLRAVVSMPAASPANTAALPSWKAQAAPSKQEVVLILIVLRFCVTR